jgi:hypothetical protein
MKFAYADPPYLGQGAKHYGKHHASAGDWDRIETHRELIERLVDEFPDGWALSASSPSLRRLWPLCPEDVRVGVWVKPFCAFKKGVRPAYAWEPVLFRSGRNRKHPPPPKGGKATTPKDFVICNVTLRKGLVGAKPPKVCQWILDLMNFQPGDTVDDLFPGTGVFSDVVRLRAGRVVISDGLFAVAENVEGRA